MLIGSGNQPRQVPVPGLQQPVRLGDAIRTVTTALHIPHCSPCAQRQQRLNQMFQFVPMGGRNGAGR